MMQVTTILMHHASLARFQLLVMGLWKGDPALLEYWGPHHMTLMALSQLRVDTGGLGTATLKDEFARHGNQWVHDERGQILLVETDETCMRPTWAVPDDTRGGLRAADLSGDKFELARR
ncbi:hypothetical protein SLS63_007758 [Diaporthe eres]|uniref:EthD domain-containing protein n=1 Tax=Diaporthe eres TaxID=83184 RepID=A0ABR1P4V9_DIAER